MTRMKLTVAATLAAVLIAGPALAGNPPSHRPADRQDRVEDYSLVCGSADRTYVFTHRYEVVDVTHEWDEYGEAWREVRTVDTARSSQTIWHANELNLPALGIVSVPVPVCPWDVVAEPEPSPEPEPAPVEEVAAPVVEVVAPSAPAAPAPSVSAPVRTAPVAVPVETVASYTG